MFISSSKSSILQLPTNKATQQEAYATGYTELNVRGQEPAQGQMGTGRSHVRLRTLCGSPIQGDRDKG